MPIPQNKQELLDAIRTTHKKLMADLAGIPLERSTERSMEGHAKQTQMSVSNLLAYLIGWGELVLFWNDCISKQLAVEFPAKGYKWTELGDLAQKFYLDYQDLDFYMLQEKLEAVVAEILDVIELASDKKLYDSMWYKQYSMGRMIQLNTSSPYKNARIRIRKWKRLNNLI